MGPSGRRGFGDSGFNSVAVDSSGNVYAAGNINGTGTYDFGNGVTVAGATTADGSRNAAAVLVKYDFSGAAQWATAVVSSSPSPGFASVAVDSSGNVYAAGTTAGTGVYDFGNGVAAAGTASYGSALLAKYDPGGIAQWARTLSADSSGPGLIGSGFSSIAVDTEGNVFVAGAIDEGTYDFGDGVTAMGAGGYPTATSMGPAGPYFVLTAKYDASGNAEWARTLNAGGSNSSLSSVAVDSAGNAYVAGSLLPGPFHSTGTYDFGGGVVITTGTQGMSDHIALVKYDSAGVAQWAHSSMNGDYRGCVRLGARGFRGLGVCGRLHRWAAFGRFRQRRYH